MRLCQHQGKVILTLGAAPDPGDVKLAPPRPSPPPPLVAQNFNTWFQEVKKNNCFASANDPVN